MAESQGPPKSEEIFMANTLLSLDYLELNGTKVEFSKGITTLIGPSGSGKSQIFLTIHSILRLWAEGIGPSSAQKATAKNLTKARLGVSWPSPAFGDVKLALGFDNETKQSEFLGTPPKGQPTWHSWYFAKAVADRLAKVLILVPQDHGLGYGNGFAPTHNWVIQAKDEINGLTTTYNTSALNEDLQKITNIRLTKPSSFALLNFKSSGKLFSSEQNKIHNANISGGQLDAFMTLCALHRKSTPQRILLLDEPGQNLGPAERRILRKVLKNRLKGTQCLIITHHVEMMNNKMLKSPNAVVQARQYLGKLVYQTVILDRFPNRAWLEYLFAWGIVIVEGATDNAVLKIILEDHEVTKRQSWLIHPSAGHDKAEEFKKFCSRCHIPCVTLLDSDTLFSGQPDPYYACVSAPTYKDPPEELSHIRHTGGHFVSNIDNAHWRLELVPESLPLKPLIRGVQLFPHKNANPFSFQSAKTRVGELIAGLSPQLLNRTTEHCKKLIIAMDKPDGAVPTVVDLWNVFKANWELWVLCDNIQSDPELKKEEVRHLQNGTYLGLRSVCATLATTFPHLCDPVKTNNQHEARMSTTGDPSPIVVLPEKSDTQQPGGPMRPSVTRTAVKLQEVIKTFNSLQTHLRTHAATFIWPLTVCDIEGLLINKSFCDEVSGEIEKVPLHMDSAPTLQEIWEEITKHAKAKAKDLTSYPSFTTAELAMQIGMRIWQLCGSKAYLSSVIQCIKNAFGVRPPEKLGVGPPLREKLIRLRIKQLKDSDSSKHMPKHIETAIRDFERFLTEQYKAQMGSMWKETL